MWEDIHEDDYGWIAKLRIVQDGVVQDISSYTTLQFIFKAPSGTITTKTATFDTDGIDGVLKYTVEDGVIGEVGNWRVQARIAKSGVELTSKELRFVVHARLSA